MNDFREYIGVDYTPYLIHFGVGADDNPPGRGSGRYPRGSGKNPKAGKGINSKDYAAPKYKKTGNKVADAALDYLSKNNILSQPKLERRFTFSNREKAAADIGCRALLDKSVSLTSIDEENLKPENLRETYMWFFFEDQTFGLPQAADLAIQGKSRAEIRDIIAEGREHFLDVCYPEDRDYTAEAEISKQAGDEALDTLFGFGEGGQYISDSYIDECIRLANERNKKR